MAATLPDVTSLVLGGAGFIGSHVAARLKAEGQVVIVADKVPCAFLPETATCTRFVPVDLRNAQACERAFSVAKAEAPSKRVWAWLFAADMGGMGYISANESALLVSNTAITANVVHACLKFGVERLFVASSACVYPQGLQTAVSDALPLREEQAWPADPQDGYGLEKLYGEQLALRAAAGSPSPGLAVRIARFHNVYGPRGSWVGGREKAPAAFLRKAALLRALNRADSTHHGVLEVWGDGSQMRSFCYIDDAVDGVLKLMASSVATPVNIGSDEAVTVKDLALRAATAVGLDGTTRIALRSGPIGVQSRNADLSAAAALGWAPRVRLDEGLRRTGAWLTNELARIEATAEAGSWAKFVRAGLMSLQQQVGEVLRFGLLVPVTSRMRGRAVEEGLRRFLVSLRETACSGDASRWQFDIVFGVDSGDAVCDPLAEGAIDLVGLVRDELPLATAVGAVSARVRRFVSLPPGSVCRIWADIASECFDAGCDYTVLLGDDIVLQSRGWPDTIHEAFRRVGAVTGLPHGFACVAFADDAFPSFPTFPVIHRTHAAVFAGRIFPESFKNQDADPFLFQIYRAFGAAVLEPGARLSNTIGGAGDARYRKRHVPWTGHTLTDARAAARRWLEQRVGAASLLPPAASGITLDVVVPTYRVQSSMLARILALRVPPGVTMQFTIICDRPGHSEAAAALEALARAHTDDPMVRIRTNDANVGAGPSRNRGLAESAADWVLFLDDDVLPDPDILAAYAAAIRAHPRATGFIGHSQLPPPANSRQAGVHLAGVAFFWGIARANPLHTELPWGVTANLCVRRPPPGSLEFDEAFPKTGGGEDIDFCLRLREHVRRTVADSEGFVAVPAAVITHPWWDGGRPALSHFSGWAGGDGHLIDVFPALTYRNLPDLCETLLALSVTCMGTAAFAVAAGHARTPPLLRAAALPAWRTLAGLLAVSAGCVAGDLVDDALKELVEEPEPACAHLSVATRCAGLVQGLLIRTVSEAGRLVGHAGRGRLLANVTRRFNWFGHMWSGAPAVERRKALRRTAVRAAFAAAGVTLLLRSWRR